MLQLTFTVGPADPAPFEEALLACGAVSITLEDAAFATLADRLWEREWLKDFRPMRFGKRLWICPGGQRPDEERSTDLCLVELDPGLAFGTGTHPTTALCLEWLDGADVRDKTVIDYGCGSGVLAIAALKLGAASAIAVDIDAQAITLSARVVPGGQLVLSGLLAEQAQRVAVRYLPWFDMAPMAISDGWARLNGVRRTDRR